MPRSYGGFGTRYCGERDYRKDGSYMTTTFFCLFFFPVFPLHTVRVIPDPNNIEWNEMQESYYLVSEKRAPNLRQVASVYLFELTVITLIALYTVRIGPVLKSRYPWLSSWWVDPLPFLLTIAPPYIVVLMLRSRARKHAYADCVNGPPAFE